MRQRGSGDDRGYIDYPFLPAGSVPGHAVDGTEPAHELTAELDR